MGDLLIGDDLPIIGQSKDIKIAANSEADKKQAEMLEAIINGYYRKFPKDMQFLPPAYLIKYTEWVMYGDKNE